MVPSIFSHPVISRPTRLPPPTQPALLIFPHLPLLSHHQTNTRNRVLIPRAEKNQDDSSNRIPIPMGGFRYPPMTKKPGWYWRTLSSLPYLIPLHHTWIFGETAYNMHPFLEEIEYVTYPFLEVLGRLPRWFFLAYFIGGYLLIVRRKEWPHFFRFHVMMGLLVEIALQIVGYVWKRLPEGLYWGKIGMHFWCGYCFAHLFTALECIRCAICGMYADVPVASDAAYIQIPYD